MLMQRLVHESFHSSYGDNALLTLGDWSIEQGNFDEARRYYRQIHPSLAWQSNRKPLPYWLRAIRGELPSSLAEELTREQQQPHAACIDSDIPRSHVWARMVLESILQRDQTRAAAELSILKKAWPDAMTTLGGQQGTFVSLLSQRLTDSNAWPETLEAADWPTFAGNAARNGSASAEIDIPMDAVWRTKLAMSTVSDSATRRRYGLPTETSGELSDQPCSHFPIVIGDLVILKDNRRLRCLSLQTGKPAWSSNEDGQFFEQRNTLSAPAAQFGGQEGTHLGQHRSTLFSGHGLVTATMGPQIGGDTTNTTLVGFDLSSQGAIQFGPTEVDSPKWTFHGAPIHDAHRCWVGMRLRDTSAQDFLACFDVHNGQQLWRTRLCSAETLGRNAIESTCNFLLSKHEDTIYVSSHLGTVVAISSVDGTIRWATKYPRRGTGRPNLTEQSWHALRDLTPCVVHNDLLIVAPSDSDRVFALDRDSGSIIWSTTVPADATKILGVGNNDHLIMSGRRLWWLDVYTGRPSQKVVVNPFPANATSEPVGVGRGLLSGKNVYWPAIEDEEAKIYVLRQSNGKPARQPIDLEKRGVTAGNLIAVLGHLLIAAPKELAVFKLD